MVKIHSYTVTGTYEFPFDMLRHDRAWPAQESEVGLLSSKWMCLDALKTPRTVSILAICPPTVERWKSFGWTVSAVRVGDKL